MLRRRLSRRPKGYHHRGGNAQKGGDSDDADDEEELHNLMRRGPSPITSRPATSMSNAGSSGARTERMSAQIHELNRRIRELETENGRLKKAADAASAEAAIAVDREVELRRRAERQVGHFTRLWRRACGRQESEEEGEEGGEAGEQSQDEEKNPELGERGDETIADRTVTNLSRDVAAMLWHLAPESAASVLGRAARQTLECQVRSSQRTGAEYLARRP